MSTKFIVKRASQVKKDCEILAYNQTDAVESCYSEPSCSENPLTPNRVQKQYRCSLNLKTEKRHS